MKTPDPYARRALPDANSTVEKERREGTLELAVDHSWTTGTLRIQLGYVCRRWVDLRGYWGGIQEVGGIKVLDTDLAKFLIPLEGWGRVMN
jgi:hypothetical protein